ncbi:hypothetical protein WICMUC_004801 [Wickerhamomyces mucosus]|uniref:Spt20-like SEP domain-containing protein n=1 Tax=Wickerhamomyces mucosus TaxID=1378264 RepID=A0A9P8PF20_9ASCO|nr:hypothetical protein WICMUC_004801 [Wickerhamomyces mucosus]
MSVNQNGHLKRSYNDMTVRKSVNGGIESSSSAISGDQQQPQVQTQTHNGSSNRDQELKPTAVQQPQQSQQASVQPQQQQEQQQSQPPLIQRQHQYQQHQRTLLNRRGNHKFAETTEEILKKYEQQPSSLEFHIHENHYRFGNQDGIISKNNLMIKDFLEYVAREEIPQAIVEVLRDAGIRLYEGCIILKIFDHRNTKTITIVENNEKLIKKIPRSYKTLLKPTSLSLFYDLLYQTDSALQRFTDGLGLNMESEILTITKRNLDLTVPLNPYNGINDSIKPVSEFPKIANGEILHNHRLESADPNSKAFKPFRELHEDSLHQTSDFEQLMLIMNDKPNSKESGNESSQFTRLRFLEQYRLDKEKQKHSPIASNLSARSFSNGLTTPSSPGNANANLTPLQQQQLQQQRLQQLQQQRLIQQQQGNKVSTSSPLQNQQSIGDAESNDQKKPKKPKKLTKKQLAAQAASANSTGQANSGKVQPGNYADKTLPGALSNGEPPKKKRGTYKKKNKDNANSNLPTPTPK